MAKTVNEWPAKVIRRARLKDDERWLIRPQWLDGRIWKLDAKDFQSKQPIQSVAAAVYNENRLRRLHCRLRLVDGYIYLQKDNNA